MAEAPERNDVEDYYELIREGALAIARITYEFWVVDHYDRGPKVFFDLTSYSFPSFTKTSTSFSPGEVLSRQQARKHLPLLVCSQSSSRN